MKQYYPISKILFAVLLVFVFSSCSNYYKAIQARASNNNEKAVSIDSLNKADRYMILRNSQEAYHMKNISLSNDMGVLECVLDTVSKFDKLHLIKGKKGKRTYRKTYLADFSVLNEAHCYIAPDTATRLGKYTLSLEKINKIEVIIKDKKRTTNSYVLGGVGIIVVLLATASLIALSSWKGLGGP